MGPRCALCGQHIPLQGFGPLGSREFQLGNRNMTAHIARQLDSTFTRQQGCPMSQAPRKPLFWHALFVTVCLFLVYCVLVYSVSRVQERNESAQHKTAAFHIHMKKHKEMHIRSFFLSARSRSAVAVEVGLPETGSSSGFVLAIRNRLERKSHCRQIPASHHRGCG